MTKFKFTLGIFAICLLAFAAGCTSKTDVVQSSKKSDDKGTEKAAQNGNGSQPKQPAANGNGNKNETSKKKSNRPKKIRINNTDLSLPDFLPQLPRAAGGGGDGKKSKGDTNKNKQSGTNNSSNQKNKSNNGNRSNGVTTKKITSGDGGNGSGDLSVVLPGGNNKKKKAKFGGGNDIGSLSASPGGNNARKRNKNRGRPAGNRPPPPGPFRGGGPGGGNQPSLPGTIGGPGGGGYRPGGASKDSQDQIAAVVQSFVSAVSENKLKGIDQYILKRAKGNLRSLLSGKIDEKKLKTIQEDLEGLTLKTPARRDRKTGNLRIVYKNAKDKTVTFLLRNSSSKRKADKKWKIREMKVSRAR